jgi:hypothetical protein
MPVARTRTVWNGITGAPGYTELSFITDGTTPTEGAACISATVDFFTSVSALVATTTNFSVDSEISFFNEATGALEEITAVSPAPDNLGGGFGSQGPGPTGAVIGWSTGGINWGRRVRGRTFIVPLAAGCYQSDGTLTSGTVTQLSSAATDLVADADTEFGVWSRPRDNVGGAAFPVLTWRVPDMAAVLRSRRD